MTEPTAPPAESDIPVEPPLRTVVRDRDGDVWVRRSSNKYGWRLLGNDDDDDWLSVLGYAPLTVLVDGPVIP